jgi:hypothetical protein
MDTQEEWNMINDYNNYEVSSKGNVKNINTERILKPFNKGGYSIVGLCKNGILRTFAIHRLVAIAFLPNNENKRQVNHKDKNRLNNNLSNLEWNTATENNIHRSFNCIQTTNQNIVVWRLDKETNELLQKYDSIELAAIWCFENKLCISSHNSSGGISNTIRGIVKTCCGYKWEMNKQTSLDGEIWKNIKINEKIVENYFVSNLGRFKNSKGIIMNNYKPHHSGYVYLRVNTTKYALHRLIASTFIINLHDKLAVNHIDGNKLNNCVENLEWVTIKENNQHSHNVGIIKPFKRQIVQYDLRLNELKRFNSIKEAMDELQIDTIKKVLYNKQKTAGGFIFKYVE